VPIIVGETPPVATAGVGSVLFGAFEMLDSAVPGEPGAWVETSADGSNFGNPKAVVTEIRSMLLDGSLGTIASYENREVPLQVRFTAADGDQLARLEELLVAEVRKGGNMLTYTPSVAFAEPAVFEVVWSEIAVDWSSEWDLDEVMRVQRAYGLTLTCRPFARSLNPVTVPAVPAPPPGTPPAPLTMDNGSSTTGWSSTTGTVATIAGSVENRASAGGFSRTSNLTRTFATAVDVGARQVIEVAGRWLMEPGDTDVAPSSRTSWVFTVNGVAVTPLALSAPNRDSSTGGLWTATLPAPDADVASIAATLTADLLGWPGNWPGSTLVLDIDEITAKSVALVGTARQRSQLVEVYGSRRTEMSLLVDSLSSDTITGQGTQTLVFTEPANTSGFTPALGQYRTGGGTRDTDANKLSGSTSTLATSEAGAEAYEIPVGLLADGTHEIVAALAPGATGTAALVRWSLTFDSPLSSSLRVTGSALVPAVASANLFRFVSLGRVTLPLAATEGESAAKVVLKVWDDSAAPSVVIDETYLFNTTDGQLTIVDTDTADALRIDAATVENPKPTVWLLDSDGAWQAAADRASARDQHVAEPGLLSVFVASMRSLDWTVSGNYYPRWDTHPRRLDL